MLVRLHAARRGFSACSRLVGASRGMATSSQEELVAMVNNSHPYNNVPESIKAKLGAGLLHKQAHPICTIKSAVATAFTRLPDAEGGIKRPSFRLFDDESPVVTVKQNFDDLLTPPDHVSRKPSDTFYVDKAHLLRCHTSAHQTEKLRKGEREFLVAADCFRRDEIDSTHYPIFHQMEGVRIFEPDALPAGVSGHPDDPETVRYVCDDLKASLQCMVDELFGESECRWNEDFFPFTEPSFELEIKYQGEWLELLGCGMVHRDILANCGMPDRVGWAFGIGLERVAMARFGIPDIRLFWTEDDRFHKQFDGSMSSVFESYSKYPPCLKDVTFWLPDGLHQHDIFEQIRESAGDLVEKVELIDEFTHPKHGRTSHCYRIAYRSMERNLTNEEINSLQTGVRDNLVKTLGVELR
jgi:phenylalanyl-tRNA synthetase alpha chain